MGATLLKWVVLLVVVTTFTLSNRASVTVSFWQWPIYNGPLAYVIVGAALIGALLTYLSSVTHHLRQGRHIRSLQESVRAHEARQAQTVPGQTGAMPAPPPSRPVEDTRRLP